MSFLLDRAALLSPIITQPNQMADIAIEQQNNSVSFGVRVIPRSSKSEIVGVLDGVVKIKLKSPPVDGAANDELIRLLSKELSVPRSAVAIASGHTSKTKRVRVTNVTKAQIASILKAKS